MKKRTSKSVSATPEASSQSGTPTQTDGTANNPPKKFRGMGKFAYVLEELHKQTRQEFLDSLVRVGIYDEDGNLTERYGGRKKQASKEKPRDGGEPAVSADAPSRLASGKATSNDAMEPAPQESAEASKVAEFVEALNKLPPAKFRKALRQAGIINEDDKLTEKYRQPTKKGKRKQAS